MNSRLLIILITLLLAALGTVVAVGAATESNTSAVSSASSPLDAMQSRSVPGGLIVWVTPDRASTVDDVMYDDGVIEARTSAPDGETIVTNLGPGTTARLVAGGDSPILWIQTYSGQSRLLRYSPLAGTWTRLLTLTDEIAAISAGSGYLDVVMDGEPGVVQTTKLGSTDVVSTPVKASTPKLAADPRSVRAYSSQGNLELLLSKSHMTTEAMQGRITSLVRSGDTLYAFSCTGLAAAITDTTSGVSRCLEGYSWVHAAGLGGDGWLYAAVDAAGRGTSLHLLKIDPQTLAIDEDRSGRVALDSRTGFLGDGLLLMRLLVPSVV